MKKVFIPTNSKIPVYKQFPSQNHVWGNYEFVFGKTCDECDIVVVCDTVESPISVKCRKGGTVLFPMETKSIKRYPKNYLLQFETAFCYQDYLLKEPNTLFSIAPFPWMLLYDFYTKDDRVYNKYDYFEMPDMSNQRKNKFCIFTSNKKMSRGHCDRLHFVDEIKNRIPELVDVYGNGFNNVNIKYDIMTKYKYCIAIENDSKPYYRTEKLADAILAGCYPLYYGDPKINDFFSKREVEVLNIFDIDSSVNRMEEIVRDNIYEGKINDIISGRNKVLQDWNMFALIAKCLDKIELLDEAKEVTIEPLSLSRLSSYFNRFKQHFYSTAPYSIVRIVNF